MRPDDLTNPIYRAAITKVFESDAALDGKLFSEVLTADGTFQLGETPVVVGREAVAAHVTGFFGTLKSLHHDLIRAWQLPTTLIYEAQVNYILGDGRALTIPYANVLDFDGDLIRNYRIYIDLSPMAG